MSTEAEIRAKYKKLHDDLTERYYQRHELTKEEFDLQHGKIWADMEAELIAGGYLTISPPPRNLEAEIDELKKRVERIERKFQL